MDTVDTVFLRDQDTTNQIMSKGGVGIDGALYVSSTMFVALIMSFCVPVQGLKLMIAWLVGAGARRVGDHSFTLAMSSLLLLQ